MKQRWTAAAVAAALKGDIENAIIASTPGVIERQEAQGQRGFVTSTTLPIRFNCCSREQFEAMGIVFGEPVDDLFREVQLPAGWEKRATDHSMHSELVDSEGRARASIFYKAAFYDRRADISLKPRFTSCVEPVGGWKNGETSKMWHGVVLDCDKEVWHSDEIGPEPGYGEPHEVLMQWYATKDKLAEAGKRWLDEHYPEWRDPLAYWD